MATRIREARQARGWSQQDLAERIGVSQPTIVHWEQGTHTPRNLALARLADTLGVSRQWLKESPPPQASIQRAPLPQDVVSRFDPTTPDTSAYLRTPIHHVPVFDGPLDEEEVEACLTGGKPALTYVSASAFLLSPIGLIHDDASIAKTISPGSIAIIDCADKTLSDGKFYLVSLNGVAKLRRFFAIPARFETDRPDDTLLLQSQPIVLGRLVMTIQRF
jgi:transcriptional regulator with XRE-family HTH domain